MSVPPVQLSVGFVLLPAFTMTPFAALVDVLRLAADDGDGSRPVRCRWRILGARGAPVRSSAGIEIAPDEAHGDPARFDYLVVCGGLLRHSHANDPAIEDYVRAAAAAGVSVIALCTGSFTIARAGLLDGRRACVSWFHHAEFADEFPSVTPVATQLFVVDGNVVTCAGGTGAIDVGAWMIERHLGHGVARKVLDILVADDARPPTAPQPHPSITGQLRDARVRRAALLIEQRLSNPPAIETLARDVGVSRRQLERLFLAETGKSPTAFIGEARLRYARWLMATSARTLTAIAGECGFADAGHFSRRYKARFGVPPSSDRVHAGAANAEDRRPYA